MGNHMDEYGSRETSIKIEWGELGLKSSRWHQDLLWQKRIFDSPSTTVDEPNTSCISWFIHNVTKCCWIA